MVPLPTDVLRIAIICTLHYCQLLSLHCLKYDIYYETLTWHSNECYELTVTSVELSALEDRDFLDTSLCSCWAYASRMILNACNVAYGVCVTGSKYLAGSLVTGQNWWTGGLCFLWVKQSFTIRSSVKVIKVRSHFSLVSIGSFSSL